MIYALYAMGPNGEFGSAKGLPWGSFLEELEVLYTFLKEAEKDIILVGKTTYETAPPRLRQLLAQRSVLIWGKTAPKEVYNFPNHRWIRQIGKGLFKYAGSADIVAIGGKALLEALAKEDLVDVICRSTITPRLAGDVFDNAATVYLEHPTLTEWGTDSAVIVHRAGSNEKYNFIFEGIYL